MFISDLIIFTKTLYMNNMTNKFGCYMLMGRCMAPMPRQSSLRAAPPSNGDVIVTIARNLGAVLNS